MPISEAKEILRQKVIEHGFYDIDRALYWLSGIAICESGLKIDGKYHLDIKARGLFKEYGFMQPIPETIANYNFNNGTFYSVKSMEDPEKCAEVGVWYFKKCLLRYKRYDRSIMAYNAGVNRGRYINTNYYYKVRRFASEADSGRYCYANR